MTSYIDKSKSNNKDIEVTFAYELNNNTCRGVFSPTFLPANTTGLLGGIQPASLNSH